MFVRQAAPFSSLLAPILYIGVTIAVGGTVFQGAWSFWPTGFARRRPIIEEPAEGSGLCAP